MIDSPPIKQPSRRPESEWTGPALALLGSFAFSGKAIFAKLAYAAASLDAVTLIALRMLYSLPFFGAMIWWSHRDKSQPPLTRRDWTALLWLGFFGYYLASFLDFWGLEYISAGLERLILFTNPTIVVVLSALWFKKRITYRTAIALLLTYLGIAVVFAQDLVVTADTKTLFLGGALVFASAISYAVYLVWNGEIIARIGAARFTAYGMAVSSVFVMLQFALTRPLSALVQPVTVNAMVASMAIFSTVLPIWLTSESIRRIGAGRVAMIGTTGPIMTIGLGAIFLGEAITLVQLAGAALVIAGVVLVSFSRRT